MRDACISAWQWGLGINLTIVGCLGGTEVHEGEILKELPVHLRAKLVCHVLRDVFQNSYIFKVLFHKPLAQGTPGILAFLHV